jgi:twitching motility two-component system response regulator PilH
VAVKGLGIGRLFQRKGQPQPLREKAGEEHGLRSAQPRPKPGTKVLIVDDSKTIQVVLGRMIRRYGYEVLSAYDGEQALRVAKEQQPALILMDVVMPRMNGFQATREIRHHTNPQVAAIPVLIMSGNAQPSEEFWSAKIKANGFLAKPFEDEELLAHMARLLSHEAVIA